MRLCVRLIPAGAGHIRRQCPSSPPTTAHPRWRGAHTRPNTPEKARFGSSPLARGTCRRRIIKNLLQRLIPAGAGHMPPCQQAETPVPAHPRWRGAHDSSQTPYRPARGSSPLARGTCLMICIYSKTVLILHLTQNKRHGYSYLTYRYLRRRRAVAHPLRGLLLVVLLSGRIMRVMPSKSVGIQS